MFKPIKNKKVYQQVIEQIQYMILKGELKKGDKLPSERTLVEQLKVSRASIREALRGLEIIGLVESRQGEGNFIRGNLKDTLFEPLSIMFMLNNGKASDILEIRMSIEIEAAKLASKRATKDDLEELKKYIDELKNSKDELESSKIDKKLHYKIAKISNNYLMITLLDTIESLMDSFIKDSRKLILKEEKNKPLLIKQHEDIVNAIIESDQKKAVKAMKEHLESINSAMEELSY